MIDYCLFEKCLDSESIKNILLKYNHYFIPSLLNRVDADDYSKKLSNNSNILIAKQGETIIGFLAFYYNPFPKDSYVALLAVDQSVQNLGVGSSLVRRTINYCMEKGSSGILLEMRADNSPLLKFYKKLGFIVKEKFSSPYNDEIKFYLHLKL